MNFFPRAIYIMNDDVINHLMFNTHAVIYFGAVARWQTKKSKYTLSILECAFCCIKMLPVIT